MKCVSKKLLEDLSSGAAASPRLRANHNLHPLLEDPVQRFLNAMEPGTYVRPHRHGEGRWELFLALRGAAVVLFFGEGGAVSRRVELSPDGPCLGVEVSPETWHTVASLAPGTVLLEVKPGPYVPTSDKDFAVWAPREGEPTAGAFETWFRRAQPGDGMLALLASGEGS